MRTLIDKTTPLSKVLKDYDPKTSDKLVNKRAFYVVEANADRGKTIKFGVAGVGKGTPWARLNDYRLMYGTTTPDNDCLGVKVHYLGTTEYNGSVESKNSQVFQVEAIAKDRVRSKTMPTTGERRGFERTDKENTKEIIALAKSRGVKDKVTAGSSQLKSKTTGYQLKSKTSGQRRPIFRSI